MNKKALILGSFLVIIFAFGVGFWQWENGKNEEMAKQATVDPQQIEPVPDVTEQPQEEQENNAPASWRKFDSKIINLSFAYWSDSEFKEEDFPKGEDDHKGLAVYFSNKGNNPITFEAFSEDFVDSHARIVVHDTISGKITSEKSFKDTWLNPKYTKIIKRHPGVYQIIGYSNWECSPFVESSLIIAPPKGSGLKYIKIGLGASGFLDNELMEVCTPKESVIRKKIDLIVKGANPEITKQFNLAMQIAKTFSVEK